MGIFKSKYDKLDRSEVVNAIVKLQKESKEIEMDIEGKQKAIDDLLEKGKKEKSKDVKLFYAKKVNAIKAEREQMVQRSMYLLYNIRLLEKLKQSIDDNNFFSKTKDFSLGNLLADQKGLAKFLSKTLDIRTQSENVLVNADETFTQFEEIAEPNESIYGKNDKDDELLAMFEDEESIDVIEEIKNSENVDSKIKNEGK